MTNEQFHDWRNSYVTEEIMTILQDRIDQLEYEIARSAGDNPQHDSIRRGYIAGLEDLLKIEFEEETPTNVD